MPTRLSIRARRPFASLVILGAVAAWLIQPAAMPAAAAPARPELRPATPELIERAVRRGEVSEAEGALYLTWAFTAPARLPETYVSDTPWSGTLPLLRLRERLPALGDAPAAAAARTELRGTAFACPGTSGSLPQTRSTSHFHVQYKASALQGLSVGSYTTALETTWTTEIGRFGWARPPADPVSYPPGRRYPVRIENLGTGLYGYVAGTRVAGNNPSTPWNDRDAVASCMVLNRDFGQFPGTPLDALRATAAHEFNHSIQFGYGALGGAGKAGDVMVEGMATWMEDEVFDSSNDSYNYLWPQFAQPMGRYTRSPYPYWVVFRAMAERFGSGERNGSEAVYQTFWEQVGKGNSTNLEALAKAFKAENTTLADAYHGAAIALRFLADCSTTPRKYCLDEGPAYALAAGSNDDHATLGAAPISRTIPNDFALNWIGLPTAAGTDLMVTHDGGRGVLRVGVACLTGGSVSVTPVGTATRSAEAAASNLDLSGCDAASVVISNVKRTAATPSSITRTDYTIETG